MIHTEEAIKKREQINELWQSGCTIGEINDEFNLITVLPEHLRAVTKDTRLDFSKRLLGDDVKISCLLLKGFYIVDNGVEFKHLLNYTTFKFLEIRG